jgi:hypothetical protein
MSEMSAPRTRKKTYRETLPPAALDSGLLVSVLWAKVGFEAFLCQKSEILPVLSL